MKKLVIAASVAASLMSVNVQADTLLGLYLGGQIWDSAASGVFGDSNEQTDFNLKDEQQGSYFIALEHPIPLIPNIKIASTTLDTVGQTTLEFDFSFGGKDFKKSEKVSATFDMSYIDYTLYYEILDNDVVTLDLGLTARDIDGNISVGTNGASIKSTLGTEDVSYVLPMVYASIIVGLPLTGLSVFAEGNIVSYDSQTLYDYQAGVGYALLDNFAIDLDITLGYREVKMDLDDLDNLYADLNFKGAYLGAVIHF